MNSLSKTIFQRNAVGSLAIGRSISYSAFNEMLNGKRSLSSELTMMMEAALGVDAAPCWPCRTNTTC